MLQALFGPSDKTLCCSQSTKGDCVKDFPEDVEGEIHEGYHVFSQPATTCLVRDRDRSAGPGAGASHSLAGTLPAGPAERMVPTFATERIEALPGEPLHSGSILRLMLGDSVQEMTLTLYLTGFVLRPNARGDLRSASRLWSPFSLVEKCKVKSIQDSENWAVFKLTIFRREGLDLSYYFGCTGPHAHQERDAWVSHMASAISNVTLSLFPSSAITVRPLAGKESTCTRIMAGYLLLGGYADKVTLLYCELHGHFAKRARLVLYKDEWCEHEVLSVPIVDYSSVSTRKGSYCTVFGVDQHRFCARTKEEKELWLRAVSNIKVKLMFEAPEPTLSELEVFRAAVGERLEALPPPPISTPRGRPRPVDDSGTPAHAAGAASPGGGAGAVAEGAAGAEASDGARGDVVAEPLLMELPRRPPDGPRGDASDPPEPLDDDLTSDYGVLAARPATGEVPRRKLDSLEPEECRRLLASISRQIDASAGLQPPGQALFTTPDGDESAPHDQAFAPSQVGVEIINFDAQQGEAAGVAMRIRAGQHTMYAV